MVKIYTALGLMSGTSMDGVDASIIQSDGESKYKVISNKYFEYKNELYSDLINFRDQIGSSKDLKKFENELKLLEKKITLFQAESANSLSNDTEISIDLISFHGQTVFHNAEEKISVQLGDGKLLSKLTKKKVVYNFRQNDLKNGGEGAPLTPIFHQILERKFSLKPVSFFNIGGIINRTTVGNDGKLSAADCGPGMCLIDKWIRKNSKNKYDKNGDIAKHGEVNQKVLNKYLDIFRSSNFDKKSYDTSDFDILLVKDLSLEDGAATLTSYTANLFKTYFDNNKKLKIKEKIILCGGGRKNKFLVNIIKSYNEDVNLIDDYGIDGDFVESQAFGYLGIRSFLMLPISFPETTNVEKPCTGGVIVENF